jgi:hypothetical protein
MSDNKIIKMIRLLQQRTDDKKISWEETIHDNTYQSAFPVYTIQIGQYTNENSIRKPIDYYIRILDDENKVIEEATDIDLNNEEPFSYQIMENLYKNVRRQVMGFDKALDSILSELESDD